MHYAISCILNIVLHVSHYDMIPHLSIIRLLRNHKFLLEYILQGNCLIDYVKCAI